MPKEGPIYPGKWLEPYQKHPYPRVFVSLQASLVDVGHGSEVLSWPILGVEKLIFVSHTRTTRGCVFTAVIHFQENQSVIVATKIQK